MGTEWSRERQGEFPGIRVRQLAAHLSDGQFTVTDQVTVNAGGALLAEVPIQPGAVLGPPMIEKHF